MITYPLDAPNTLGFPSAQKTKLSGWNTVAMSTSPYTGSQQLYKWPGEGWKLDVQLPPMKISDAEAWVSFLLALRGRMGTFLFGDTARKTPQGVATGTPVAAAGTTPQMGVYGAHGTTTNTDTFLLAIAVGDCVVLFANTIGNNGGNGSYTVSDSGGNTYAQVGPAANGAAGHGGCWICLSAAAAAFQVTITANGTTPGVSMSGGTFKGVVGIGGIHFTSSNQAPTTMATDTIATSKQNVMLAVGIQAWCNPPSPTITGHTGLLVAQYIPLFASSAALQGLSIWGVANPGTPVTTTMSFSVGMLWQVWTVELYGASSINGNQQGGNQINIGGVTPLTKNIYKAGDYLEVPNALNDPSTFDAGGGDNTGLTATTIDAETGHNTSANAAYSLANFAANFTGKSWVNQNGQFIYIDKNRFDDSRNPITPVHVSPLSVKTLVPGYTGKYYTQFEPYHWTAAGGHIDIGIDTKSTVYIAKMLADMQARGIDGVTLDWYGPNRWEDDVCLLVKAAVATMTNFTFAIMLDTQAETVLGGGAYNTTAKLQTLLTYLQTNYLGATNYWKISTAPVLLFWGNGPTGTQASVDFATGLATLSPAAYVMFQGPGPITFAYSQGTYDWVQPYLLGVNAADPYNLAAKTSYLNTVKTNTKGAMPAISPKFNGTLTRTTVWSMGKELPSDDGKCWVSQAALINANLPNNCIGIYLVTWNDWQEGSEIESGIDNEINVNAVLASGSNAITWSLARATPADETTVSSYKVIATTDGVNAVIVGTVVPNNSTVYSFDLGNLARPCTVYVIAIGIACVNSKVSNPVIVGTVSGGGGGGTTSPSRLYKILKDVNSDSAGNVTVDVFPRLRESIPTGTPLKTQGARGTFRLVNNQQDWNIDQALNYGISFQAIEAI